MLNSAPPRHPHYRDLPGRLPRRRRRLLGAPGLQRDLHAGGGVRGCGDLQQGGENFHRHSVRVESLKQKAERFLL